jgi:hypothetical protein
LIAPVVIKYRNEWFRRVAQRRDDADQFAVSKMLGEITMEKTKEKKTLSRDNLYAYLDSIPDIRKALDEKAKPEWDSGVTARMNQATYDYIDGLQGVLVGLAKYYSLDAFDGEEPHEFFSEIISSRFRWHWAHADPKGRGTGGTIARTICGGSVLTDIENMVVDMVLSLIDCSDEYSWKYWKRKWENKAT